MRVANVFHAGDGNLHPLVLYDAAKPGEAERAEECAGQIVKACVDLGGSITGEHGVGVDKKRYMPSMFGEPDLAAFQMLRCAFDPDGLRQPGQADADAAAVRRGARAVPRSIRSRPPGWRSGSDAVTTRRRDRTSRRAAAELLRDAGGPVRIAGAGTKRALGQPRRTAPRALLDRDARPDRRAQRGRPDRRRPGGRAARARCSETLAEAGQMLALDPPGDDATIGGIVATGDSGPLRHRYGGAARPRARRDGRAAGRHRRARGRQGDQERRGLRPGEADGRRVRDARR